MGVSELVLDDRDPGHEGIDARCSLGGQVVGGRRDQFGVATDGQGVLQLFQVGGRHLRRGLDEVTLLEEAVEANLVRGGHG
jgi:hypothetical protein